MLQRLQRTTVAFIAHAVLIISNCSESQPILSKHLIRVPILVLAQSLTLAVMLPIVVHLRASHTVCGFADAFIDILARRPRHRICRSRRRGERVPVDDCPRVWYGSEGARPCLLDLRDWSGLVRACGGQAFCEGALVYGVVNGTEWARVTHKLTCRDEGLVNSSQRQVFVRTIHARRMALLFTL